MRLINTKTLRFQEFFDPPPYAILSHRWTDQGEVSFEEYNLIHEAAHDGEISAFASKVAQIQRKSGYKKILEFCRHAASSNGCQWVWIDTCCIDKKSSAELSEAINSMYKWYQGSDICYILLSDVPPSANYSNSELYSWLERFKSSAWFKRCWTLQELLAPLRLLFCDGQWNAICELQKMRANRPPSCSIASDRLKGIDFFKEISRVTTIDSTILDGTSRKYVSIARRMSWAASREATRAEDVAYSLLGVLGVNLPLLYGEGGARAFMRLQREILDVTQDESILAWDTLQDLSQMPSLYNSSSTSTGVLARQPNDFKDGGNIAPLFRLVRNSATDPLAHIPGSFSWRRTYGLSQSCLLLSSDSIRAFFAVRSSRLFLRAVIFPLYCNVKLSGRGHWPFLLLLPCDDVASIDNYSAAKATDCLGRHVFFRRAICSSTMRPSNEADVPDNLLPPFLRELQQVPVKAEVRAIL